MASFRSHRSMLMVVAGFCFALGASIKPTAVLFLIVPLLVLWQLKKQGLKVGSYFGWGLVGCSLATIIIVGFLIRQHSFIAFFHLIPRLDAIYSKIGHPNFRYVFNDMFTEGLTRRYFFFALILWAAQSRLRKNFEYQVLLLCVFLGIASFFIQGKGFPYHQYPYLAFSCLWVGMVLVDTLRSSGWIRYVAAALLVLLVCVQLPRKAFAAAKQQWNETITIQLQKDLTDLGAMSDSGRIQCMDFNRGCTTVLYRMKLVEATDFIMDYQFYIPGNPPIAKEFRERFLRETEQKKTQLIIVTNGNWPTEEQGFEKLDEWPELKQYLMDHYRLAVERSFSDWKYSTPKNPAVYRIYVRK